MKASGFIRILAGIVIVTSSQTQASDWSHVKTGKKCGISGMAIVSEDKDGAVVLIAHDNKQPGEDRLALIDSRKTGSPKFTPLSWPANTPMPVDTEALCAMPGADKSAFLMLTSGGQLTKVKLDAAKKSVEVTGQGRMPGNGDEFEGLSLASFDGKLVAVWGERGSGTKAGSLSWGIMDPNTLQVSGKQSQSLTVPWPEGPNVRHISGLFLDAGGVLYSAAASDAGDDGPFEGAIYKLGSVKVAGDQVTFSSEAKLEPLVKAGKHKIEGMVLLSQQPGAILAGSDDENAGSYFARFTSAAK